MENIEKNLVELCDAYADHSNITHWRVSFLVRGDGLFFKRLKEGRTCTLKTARKVSQYFSNNWEDDLEWPADIPRPPQSKKKEVA